MDCVNFSSERAVERRKCRTIKERKFVCVDCGKKFKSRVMFVGHECEEMTDELEKEIEDVCQKNWRLIRDCRREQGRLCSCYNYCVCREGKNLCMEELRHELEEIFQRKKRPFKVNFSFGFVLRHQVTGDLRYYYASRNNNLVLHTPILVKGHGDLGKDLRKLEEVDPFDYAYWRKPNSQKVVVRVTNITWFITDVPGAGLIGSCCCGDALHWKGETAAGFIEMTGCVFLDVWLCMKELASVGLFPDQQLYYRNNLQSMEQLIFACKAKGLS